jgi:hypothetical protein
MSRPDKGMEQFYVNLLREKVVDFPVGPLERTESPDFTVTNGNMRLGIEVTRLHKAPDRQGLHLQVQESERRLLIREATRLYEQMHGPPVEIWLHFGVDTRFCKANRGRFAGTIAAFVAQHVPNDNSAMRFHNDYLDSILLPDEVNTIAIARFGHTENAWHMSDSGWVQTDFIEELQRAIDGKNTLLPQYRAKCNTNWLLIVADGATPASLFEASEKTLSYVYRGDFERVYLLERVMQRLHSLSLRGA